MACSMSSVIASRVPGDCPGVSEAAGSWPLTEGQAGLWFAQRMAPDNPSFNTGHVTWIAGGLDVAAFTRAADQAAREAESLALVLYDGPQGPVQWLDPSRSPRLEHIDLRHHANPQAQARTLMQCDMLTPIDLMKVPLARQCLFILGPQRFAWFQRAHHLANDGYGMALWGTRVSQLYTGLVTRAPYHGPLAPLKGVIDEDAAYKMSERRAQDALFWREAFSGVPEVVGMARSRPISPHTCHRLTAPIGSALLQRVLAFAQSLKLPWPDVLVALTAAYLLRMSSTIESVVGVPYMGRLGSASARATATVMNVLPLRVHAPDSMLLIDFIQALARDQFCARRHGRYRSEQLRRDLGLLGGHRRLYGPIIDVQPFYRPLELPGVQLALEILSTGPIDDITIGFRGDGLQHLNLQIEANSELYKWEATQAHQERLLEFLASALGARTLGDIPLASATESRRYLFDVNATEHPVPDTTLTALIEARMAQAPQAIALDYEGATLSYGDLDARTRSLALELQSRGVGRDTLVAVALPRSQELLVALVAVLRAGAAYLPLDLSQPPERIARILALAKPVCVLVRGDDAIALPANIAWLHLEAWPAPSGEATLSVRPKPEDAAYAIYTSGSTGEPKGVLVEHRAIVNRLEWMRQHYGFDESDRILQKTPATFDVSVWEFFLPLITGCTLVIAPPEAHKDPAWLARLIRQRMVDTCHFVPSMLAAFLSTPGAQRLRMRRIFCSGEELSASLRDQFHATLQGQLHNLYGPTEAAVDVSYWSADVYDKTTPVPIGFPVWNMRMYVLDARMQPLPAGVSGDLYLGGVQLARGYLGRNDLTAERFLPDPYRQGERIYKTGDLARWREDGSVVYLGRSDRQIKLRGLRIELGDIEAAMAGSGLVKRSAVIVCEDRLSDKRLVAYLQPCARYSREALRTYLGTYLPDYMVPAAFVTLDDWPVTSNGKLDRCRLPVPHIEALQGEAPRSPTEVALAQLFKQVLPSASATLINVDTDFFSLGGDSLSAVKLLLLVQNQWQRNPGLGALFAAPTLGALATAIDSQEVCFDSGLAPLLPLVIGESTLGMLFAVHPAGGIAWGYSRLARALADAEPGKRRTIYGLQSPALEPGACLPHSIEELARQYVQRILDMQPRGPIHLLGWSVGGIIAQAMAVELQVRGCELGMVALLDAYPADVWRAEPEPTPLQALRALLSVAGYDPEGHAELKTRGDVVAFLHKEGSALGHLPECALDGVVRVVIGTNRLIREHNHRRFEGTLTHVRASQDHVDKPHLQAACWLPYAAQLDELEVPMLHARMLGEDAMRLMVPALLRRIVSYPPAA